MKGISYELIFGRKKKLEVPFSFSFLKLSLCTETSSILGDTLEEVLQKKSEDKTLIT